MSLDELRKKLSAVDRRLVEMIAERQRIVARNRHARLRA